MGDLGSAGGLEDAVEPRLTGPWTLEEARRHLDAAQIPLRLACRGPSGFPLVASLWYLHEDAALWCATRPDAAMARLLRADGRCGFEVAADAPPYRGVRGRARATLLPERGAEILERLVLRYRGSRDDRLGRWLLSRADDEVAIRLDPERLVTWDYGRRMGEG